MTQVKEMNGECSFDLGIRTKEHLWTRGEELCRIREAIREGPQSPAS